MNKTNCVDIQTLIDNNIDITNILVYIKQLIEIYYPDFVEWFNNTLIPGLDNKERNIILLYKKDELIGFINLKKTDKERKMSNLYLKSCLFHEYYAKLLINEAINWLETDKPIMIISNNQMNECANTLLNKNWNVTHKFKYDNKTTYYVLNGQNEFTHIEKLLKQKSKKRINSHKNN